MLRSDSAPSSWEDFVNYTPLQGQLAFNDEPNFPAALDPLNDEGSAFNTVHRRVSTPRPLPDDSHLSGGGDGGGDAAACAASGQAAATPRSSAFAAAGTRIEAVDSVISESVFDMFYSPNVDPFAFDDPRTRLWLNSPTPMPPPHAADNTLSIFKLPGYNPPAYLRFMKPEEVTYIHAFEAGRTSLGATHKMTPQKLIVTVNFPAIMLASQKDEGDCLTKELMFEQMQRQHCEKFAFEEKKQKKEGLSMESEDDFAPSAKKSGGVSENLIHFLIKLTPNMQVTGACDVCLVFCNTLCLQNPMQSLMPPPKSKKEKPKDFVRCAITRCGNTRALKLVLLNVPYSHSFVHYCVSQFQVITNRSLRLLFLAHC
jgi:hypothetical protein